MRLLLLLLFSSILICCNNSQLDNSIVDPVDPALNFSVEKIDESTALIQLNEEPADEESIVIFRKLNGQNTWLETLEGKSQIYEHNHTYDFYVDYQGICLRVPYSHSDQ